MKFLASLADQVSSQFSLGENNNHSLDSVDPITGKQEKYGSLGDLAQKFDQSAERKYVEEGYLRRDPYNTNPKQFEILIQEPAATVFVKKKMFTSVAENFRPDFMDQDEKMYYRAMRILFQNKCNQISALEKLSKIEKISSAVGQFDTQLMPLVFSLTDMFTNGVTSDSGFGDNFGLGAFSSTNPYTKTDFGNFVKVIDQIRKLNAFNTPNKLTTWITDSSNLFKSSLGTGTGVIELTNFVSLNTNVATTLGAGSFGINIVDPYEMMLITEWDIEKAISDATNSFYQHKTYQFGQTSVDQVINNNTTSLNRLRALRKASPISFKVSPDSLLGKRVTAVIDRQGLELIFSYDSTGGTDFPGLGGSTPESISVGDEYLKNGAIAGFDGLDNRSIKTQLNDNVSTNNNELALFKSVVTSIYSKIQLEANSRNAIIVNNKNTNYTRRKLRFNFAGKLIVQPMDVVNIYMGSKSRYDNKILSGLNNMMSGNGILQNVNKTFTDLKSSVDLAFNPNSINIQVEKSTYVGDDFPNFLWAIMRNQFVTEKEGVHVFAGVVENARSKWGDGKFTVDIQGKDNSYYFDQGRINFKPGVDNFNGVMFDPLTPFKSNFNSITSNSSDTPPELLDENKYLLSPSGKDTKGAIVKAKAGPYAGNAATSNNVVHDQGIDPTNGLLTRTYYAPDGLVYKWKEGIGIFVQFGSSLSMNDPNKVGNPNTFNNPFAGQDIMNVLSLLITGQPYNFANFWNAAVNLQGFSNDPQTLQSPVHSYLTSLRQDLQKSNTLWGNFIPFKNLTINEQAYSQALQNTLQITTINKKIEDDLKELDELNNAGILQSVENITSSGVDMAVNSSSVLSPFKSRREQLTKDINNQLNDLHEKSKNANYLSDIAGDVSFDFNRFSDADASNTNSDNKGRRSLRRQVNQITKRMSYNVRANEDKNLFIVDDFYDKDFDILAFDASINGAISMYNGDFTDTRTMINKVSALLNLEVFADTQGHIRVRPPQYNRMPSSVFYRMMYMKQTLGIQVFPEFYSDMFNTQIKTLKERVEILEDEIRLDCAVLGNNTDKDAMVFITSSDSDKNSGDAFVFISNLEGQISDITKLLQSANPDEKEKDESFNNLEKQIKSTKPIYTNEQRFNSVFKSLNAVSADGSSTSSAYSYPNSDIINKLTSRIQTKSGQKISNTFFIKDNGVIGSRVEIGGSKKIDYFKVTSDLASKIKERQKVIKLFYTALRNANDFKSLDDNSGATATKLLTPGLFGNKNIPEVFEHMVEDESYDDYGPGSGSRYIIKRVQIKSIDIHENPPDYTAVQVNGYINTFAGASEQGPSELEVPGFGNGLTSAVAIDYDMWRTYGFKQPSVLSIPFLNDPISQCGPFAAMVLSLARKNIFRGSVTIVGNEYMQPGDVVFLEDRGMLFYVTAVNHSFSFASTGGNFTTTLTLTYGHTPGEYIPTTLDIFGKLLYKNKDIASYTVQRQSSSSNDINMGVLIKTGGNVPTSVQVSAKDSSQPTPLSTFNSNVINNILYTAANIINSNNTQGNDVRAKLELRIYYDDSTKSVDSDLQKFATDALVSFISNSNPKQSTSPPVLPADAVIITPVNMSSESDHRSPSQKAIDLARENMSLISLSGGGASAPNNTSSGGSGIKPVIQTGDASQQKTTQEHDRLRVSLFKYIVDCWVTFENKGTIKAPSTESAPDTTTSRTEAERTAPKIREEF